MAAFLTATLRAPVSGMIPIFGLAARAAGTLTILVLIFRVGNDLGTPLYGLIAGAGVGGLGVALAAKTTLEKFMGTLNLFVDRPVKVGDFCRFGVDRSPGHLRIGTVEEIGLRSTRIRGIDRTLTTIPNAEFSNLQIVNPSQGDRMLLLMRIMDIVSSAGTAIAVPSRTVYHTRDKGLDRERQQSSEQQVREWTNA
jgi:small-conductance mechanosensitive channel